MSPRRERLAWVLAALPLALLLVFLLAPSLRRELMPRGPASVRVAALPIVTPLPRLPRSVVHRAMPAPSRATETSLGPRAASVPAAPVERSPPASRATAPPLQGDRDLVVPADRVGSFLEEAYRGQLPPGIGPIEARIEGEELSVHAEVELDRLRETLRTPLPEWLRVPGKPELGLRLRVVESGNGVARLRVERVVLGGLPVPTGLLAGFLAGEVQARGFETGDDPLVRSVYLPGGFESVAVGADRTLRLERRHAP